MNTETPITRISGAQIQLFSTEDLPVPPKPKINDPHVMDRIAEEFVILAVSDDYSWINESRERRMRRQPLSQKEFDSTVKDIRRFVDRYWYTNGDLYLSLQGLEDNGWTVDDELYGWFQDNFENCRQKTYKEIILLWARQFDAPMEEVNKRY